MRRGSGPVAVPRISGVGTVTGAHPLDQADAKAVAATLFRDGADDTELERHLAVFDHSGVVRRQLCVSPDWFLEDHDFAERNRVWRAASVDLAVRAAARALAAAGRSAADVDAIVVMATTGVSTPSIDVDVIQRLGMCGSAQHETVFGRGCAAGAVGLAHAARFASGSPGSVVLAIAVEVCSVVRGRGDVGLTDLVGAALFSDGAAAVVVSTEGEGPAVVGCSGDLVPGSHRAMGWDVTARGFGLVLDRNVPAIIRRHLPASVDRACRSCEIERTDLDEVVAHPGSARVLDAVERALALGPSALADSRAVLAEHGNMSAPTVLFVLERTLARRPMAPDAPVTALLTGMGPGFAIEHVVLRW